jgi:aldehyde dehydrogenase (NAD+)
VPDYTRERLYIGGNWRPPGAGRMVRVVSPSTEEAIGAVPVADRSDVDAAVASAVRAGGEWAETTPERRATVLGQLADGLAARADELTEMIVDEVGMPRRLARPVQVDLPVAVLRSYARLLRDDPAAVANEHETGNSLVFREPAGVVAAITPWNVPLHQTVAKVAPALAAGCAVVHKPSELAPFTAYVLAEVVSESELPDGVFNLLSGPGPQVGEPLVQHPDVDVVSFTGSVPAGRRVMALAAEHVARVTLELGGKSANVILPSADLARAVRTNVNHALLNSGQACNAWTRMLVPADLLAEAAKLATEAVAALPLGDPHDPSSRLGPVRTAESRDRIRRYLREAIEQGASVAVGGPEPPGGFDRGYWVRPTVLAPVSPDLTVAREEIFGPVICILGYSDVDDAIRLANDGPYGLAAGVWAADETEALQVARQLRVGQVDVNGGRFNPMAPFGGRKLSGNGRELGRAGLDEFLEYKAVQR